MDFKFCLEEMTFALRANADKIKLPQMPKWAEGDAISAVYGELPVLLTEGNVYYSSLVQANKALFDQQVDSRSLVSAAMVIYNHNRSKNSLSNPEYLQPFAHYLFSCKKRGQSEIQEWLADAVSTIRGETDRSKVIITADGNADYPMNLTLQSLLVFRAQLPKLRLGGAVIPIIAAPGKCSSVMILPCNFWNKDFKNYWIQSL